MWVTTCKGLNFCDYIDALLILASCQPRPRPRRAARRLGPKIAGIPLTVPYQCAMRVRYSHVTPEETELWLRNITWVNFKLHGLYCWVLYLPKRRPGSRVTTWLQRVFIGQISIVLAMGLHPRLGKNAPLHLLSNELVLKIRREMHSVFLYQPL